jgi:ketosteroid isomerase-like protein
MKHGLIVSFAAGLLASGWCAASDQTDVMAVASQWRDAFNKRDTSAGVATCADETSIVDDIPPFEWHGAGACSRWMNDDAAFMKKNAITQPHVVFGTARHVDVAGDRAYMVAPADFTYLQQGKPVKETATVVMTFQKGVNGWRITGWTWADG